MRRVFFGIQASARTAAGVPRRLAWALVNSAPADLRRIVQAIERSIVRAQAVDDLQVTLPMAA